LVLHVSPPSVEMATTSGVARAFPELLLLNAAQQE
jgi:hypothetical protein